MCRDKLAFGEVRGSNVALAGTFNVTQFPRLVAVCNGDPASAETYSGDMKSAPIQKFLDQFAVRRRALNSIRLH